MTSWTDKTGRTLEVIPAGDDNPARLVITLPGIAYHPAAFWLDGETDLAEVAVALFAANGKPAPVITPRPDVDTGRQYDFGPLRMRVNPRARGVDLEEGVSSWHWAPSVARQAAGCLVALADAAETEPGPAEVDALAMVLMESNPTVMGLDGARPTARRILAAGYRKPAGTTLPGEGSGNG